ncbi:MAG: hypothetical protein QOK06_2295 [Acidimicrobiaceae bacterium]
MLFVGLVLLTGCDAPTRPERQGQITAVTVDATLAASGSLALKDQVTFVGDRGGVVPMRAPVLATVKDLTLDGSPRTDAAQSGTVELRALRRAVDVTATVDGIVERYADIVVVTVPLWGSPSDGAADDPLVPVTGTLHLPAAPLDGSIHWHGALDATFATAGADVTFRANVTMGKDADLVFALPAGAMPAVPQLSTEVRRPYFDDRQQALDRADARLRRERDDAAQRQDLVAQLYWGAVGAEIGVPILVAFVSFVLTSSRRRKAIAGVPATVTDPPGREGPAVVELVVADGRDIGPAAVAGTILWLAHRKVITLEAVGEGRYRMALAATGSSVSGAEALLLDALRPATSTGPIVGPPLPLAPDGPWRKAFRREVLQEAKAAGLLRRRYRSAVFFTSTVLLAITTAPLWFRTPEAAAAGTTVAGILLMLPFVGGYVLTSKGHRAKAQWQAFGRYIREQGDLGDVDPAGVLIWGAYLAYGAALGLAPTATHALTPGGGAPHPVEATT